LLSFRSRSLVQNPTDDSFGFLHIFSGSAEEDGKDLRTCYPFIAATRDSSETYEQTIHEIRQETRNILDLYCRKRCSSSEIRNWSGKANNNSVVCCFQRERYTHTHTHTQWLRNTVVLASGDLTLRPGE
jgi:hypothetical protein